MSANASGLVGILHPVIITGDLPRALIFYRDLLGFRVHGKMIHDPVPLARLGGPRDADAEAVILRAPDGSEIEIATFHRPAGRARANERWSDAGIRSITFTVEDIDGLIGRLAIEGYLTLGEVVPFDVEGERVLVAYVRGPDGVILTFLQRGDKR